MTASGICAILHGSVRPGLSSAEEGRLRASFKQIDSQQVDIVVEDLRVDGRTATVRLSRRTRIRLLGEGGKPNASANSREMDAPERAV